MRVETILKESCNFQKAAEVIGEHNFLPTLSQTHVLPTVDLFKSNDGLSNTGFPRFTVLMWGHKKKTTEAKTA